MVEPDGSRALQLRLDDYDFEGVTNDIIALLDVKSAIGKVIRWTFLAALGAALVCFGVFSQRTSVLAAIFIGLLAGAAALPVGVVLGAWTVVRSRGHDCVAATDRLVETLGTVHGDLEGLSGELARGALGRLAGDYLDSGVIENAALTLVPLPALARPVARPIVDLVLKAPKHVVRRSAVSIVNDLPAAALERSLDDDGLVGRLAEVWGDARHRIDATVNRVLRFSVLPFAVALAFAIVPTVLWFALAWMLT